VNEPTAALRGRSAFIEANGVRLHYLDYGPPPAPPIVFLHGGSAHAHWWDFVVPHLADRYRCVAPDLRGHGDSAWADPPDYTLSAHARDVRALIEALALRHVALIGHSFGGFVAITVAAAMRSALSALVIVDSRPRITPRSARFLEALRKLPQARYASEDDALRRFQLLPAGHDARAEVLEHVLRHGLTPTCDGAWTLKFDRRAMAGNPAQDLSPALATIACPILAIRGEHSPVVSENALAEFPAANPCAVTTEIAGAHHHVMLDRPEALAQTIRTFLEQ
jgi:pimeloyl-ACP methyl ester carboxylesterase